MKNQLLIGAILITLAAFGPLAASAQFPGGLKIPKIGKPKPKPTPAESSQPAVTPNEPSPASQPAASSAPAAQSPPVAGSGALAVLKNLVAVNTRRVTSYKGDGSTWSWTPVVTFDTNGSIPSGGHYYVAFSLPGGAPWVELDCTWASGSQKSYYQCGGPKVPEDKGTTAVGVFPFAIKMRNELKGIDQTLFTGKVKIEKAPDDNGTPAERAKKSSFYPNMDWALPIGYVYYSPADNRLSTAFWVRGSTYKVKPHLFYKGKEIDSEGTASCNSEIEVGDAYIRSVNPAPHWKFVDCQIMSSVRISDKGEKFAVPIHYLMSNPGEYEIKVLWNDELSRSIKFTVGANGDLKSGVPLLYRVRDGDGERQLGVAVPVAILDAQDGPWNKAAWKTDAFYGNPLAGFTWPAQ